MMTRKGIRLLLILFIAATMLVTACSPAQYTLTTLVSPSGSGTVTPASGIYDEGTEATLTAEPTSGYRFDHWSGDATGTSSPVTITMDSAKSVTAYFKAQFTLTTLVSPSGSGMVTPASDNYDEGTEVTLTAAAAEGYIFDHWLGDASGSDSQLTITMNSDKEITAIFVATEAYYELRGIDGRYALKGISVSSEIGGIGLRTDSLNITWIAEGGTVTLPSGIKITLVAKPSSGYQFDHWSGDVSGTSPEITINVDSDKNIYAHFSKID